MTNQNNARVQTMLKILENRPLLMQLRTEDREKLVKLYTAQIDAHNKEMGR